ncbi:MAG: collagen-like protein [Phycisphaerae bacterium]|nr:collagen-like protein [Saprospiraceae bacterium]
MKNFKFLLGLILALAPFFLSAQTTGFNYQAVIRDAAFAPLGNQNGTAQLSIFNGSTEVYRESHNINTDAVGLFNLVIGRGTPIVGNFSLLDWGSGNRFVQVSVTISGTTYDFAQSELQAVPYAKVAETTLMPGPAGPPGETGPQGPIGLTGPQGPIGLTGSQGPIGLTGAQGPIGLTGSQGPIGLTGSQGPIGLTGAQGPIGLTGLQGPIGLTGAQGPIGLTGLQGPIGLTGPQGPIGLPGPTYSAGPGINITGTVITNTGDIDPSNDLTNSSVAAGDVTGTFSNLQIAANAVGTNEIANGSIGAADIAPGVIPANVWAVTGNDIHNTNTGRVGIGRIPTVNNMKAEVGGGLGIFDAPGRQAIISFNTDPDGINDLFHMNDNGPGGKFHIHATQSAGLEMVTNGGDMVFTPISADVPGAIHLRGDNGAVGFGIRPRNGISDRIQLGNNLGGLDNNIGMIGGGFMNVYDTAGLFMSEIGLMDLTDDALERLHIHKHGPGGIELLVEGGDIMFSTNDLQPVMQIKKSGEILIDREFPNHETRLHVESDYNYAALFNTSLPVFDADFHDGIRAYTTDDAGSAAVYAENITATGYAGFFGGDVHVNGNFSKLGGTFKIDHPLDPANKYLYHSFVESPDMLNIYNGNTTTDANGFATVELPSYFEAENMDFKYQLTCIGQFAQAIVKEEVKGNSFVVQTDKPKVKVSWQVTGVRQDAYANAHRIVPEAEKKDYEKGKYLCPELFGARKEDGIGYRPLPAKEKTETKPAIMHNCSKH